MTIRRSSGKIDARMIIQYFGEGCVRLQSGELSLIVNPTSNRFKADITLRTITTAEASGAPEGEIIFPGEYEIKGIEVQGWPLPEESNAKFTKTVYSVLWEGIRFLFLGHLSNGVSAELLEEIGEPDVIVFPAGDSHFLDAADAARLVKRLEPTLVIPAWHGKGASDFVKAFGQKPEHMDKIVFKKKDLDPSKSRLIVLSANG